MSKPQLGFNGYEIAAAQGIHPNLSKLELWANKTGRTPKANDEQRARMIIGSLVTPALADAYAKIKRRTVSHVGKHSKLHRHPKMQLAVAKPNGLIHRSGKGSSVVAVLRCERVNPWQMSEWGDDGSENVPEHVLVRATWEAGVLGVDQTNVVVPASGITVYPITFDEGYFDALYEEAERFWHDHVIPDVPPRATMRDEDVLRQIYRRGKKGSLAPTEEIAELVSKYDTARAAEKAHETDKKEAWTRLVEIMGHHIECLGDGWKVTFKNNKSSTFTDWKNLTRHLGATPEQITEFTDEKIGARALRVTDKREKDE